MQAWQAPRGVGPGAVVVGGDYQGLGIVRSLGRHGIPVYVVDDERSISRFSRYAVHSTRVADLRDAAETVKVLLDLGRRHGLGGWVLYPTRDETVAAISRHRKALAAQFRVPTPEWDVIRWTHDKRNTYRMAASLGIPTPRTWYPSRPRDLDAVDADPPYVVKPSVKEMFFYATRVKAWRANTRRELSEQFDQAMRLAGVEGVVVQELVPGGGDNQYAFCALFKQGAAVASMTARRRRQHPAQFGRASTFAETVDLPALEAPSVRFLEAIGYYGLVELEYKFDVRDGRYKLLDVNARTWGYHTLGRRAGVDFPHLIFVDQTGGTVPGCRSRPGVSWVRLLTDAPTAALAIRSGELRWRDYVRSLRAVDTEAVFASDDPLPWLTEVALLPYLAIKRGF